MLPGSLMEHLSNSGIAAVTSVGTKPCQPVLSGFVQPSPGTGAKLMRLVLTALTPASFWVL